MVLVIAIRAGRTPVRTRRRGTGGRGVVMMMMMAMHKTLALHGLFTFSRAVMMVTPMMTLAGIFRLTTS